MALRKWGAKCRRELVYKRFETRVVMVGKTIVFCKFCHRIQIFAVAVGFCLLSNDPKIGIQERIVIKIAGKIFATRTVGDRRMGKIRVKMNRHAARGRSRPVNDRSPMCPTSRSLATEKEVERYSSLWRKVWRDCTPTIPESQFLNDEEREE